MTSDLSLKTEDVIKKKRCKNLDVKYPANERENRLLDNDWRINSLYINILNFRHICLTFENVLLDKSVPEIAQYPVFYLNKTFIVLKKSLFNQSVSFQRFLGLEVPPSPQKTFINNKCLNWALSEIKPTPILFLKLAFTLLMIFGGILWYSVGITSLYTVANMDSLLVCKLIQYF